MTETNRKTKPKVDLVSSYLDNERENGPLASLQHRRLPYRNFTKQRNTFISVIHSKDGEQLVYEETTSRT